MQKAPNYLFTLTLCILHGFLFDFIAQMKGLFTDNTTQTSNTDQIRDWSPIVFTTGTEGISIGCENPLGLVLGDKAKSKTTLGVSSCLAVERRHKI